MVALDPLPTDGEIAALYDTYHMTGRYLSKAGKKVRRAKRRIKRLARMTTGRRFLEVGCSAGAAVTAAADLGFEATGIDLDHYAINIARQHEKRADFQTIAVEDLAAQERQFDVIYTAEVIEHTANPGSFVSALADLSAPNGIIYLTTPDVGHWRVPQSLAQWNEVDPPFHIHYFTRQSLRSLLKKCGIDNVWFGTNLKPGIRLFAQT